MAGSASLRGLESGYPDGLHVPSFNRFLGEKEQDWVFRYASLRFSELDSGCNHYLIKVPSSTTTPGNRLRSAYCLHVAEMERMSAR